MAATREQKIDRKGAKKRQKKQEMSSYDSSSDEEDNNGRNEGEKGENNKKDGEKKERIGRWDDFSVYNTIAFLHLFWYYALEKGTEDLEWGELCRAIQRANKSDYVGAFNAGEEYSESHQRLLRSIEEQHEGAMSRLLKSGVARKEKICYEAMRHLKSFSMPPTFKNSDKVDLLEIQCSSAERLLK